MNKLQEMIKRRKDQGFTLIELMIVIAVIGILAIVLVPKFGNIKTSAKDTGVTTNFRSVTAAVHAVKFNKDDDSDGDVASKVAARLEKDFAGNNVLVNPYTKLETINKTDFDNAAVIVTSTVLEDASGTGTLPESNHENKKYIGAIVVQTSITTDTKIPTVTVYGCDDKGRLIEGLEEVIQP